MVISQQILNGMLLGCIYTLIAVAFTLGISVLNFLNFSIPGLFVVGAVVGWVCLKAGWGLAASVFCALLVCVLCSLIVERLSYRRLRTSEHEIPLVSSLGFLLLFESIVLATVGSDQQAFPSVFPLATIEIGGLLVSTPQVLSLIVAIVLVGGISYGLRVTKTGRSIRAISENYDTAQLLGIKTDAIVMCVFVLIGLLAGFAGLIFAMNYLQVSPLMGEEIGNRGVAAMIVGGMGSVWGAVLGGLLIGVCEVLGIHFFGAGFANIVVYGMLLAILMFKPEGLLGGSTRVREKL